MGHLVCFGENSCSAVRNMVLLPRTGVRFLATIHKSSSRGPGTFLWPPQAPAYTWHTYIQAGKSHAHEINKSKNGLGVAIDDMNNSWCLKAGKTHDHIFFSLRWILSCSFMCKLAGYIDSCQLKMESWIYQNTIFMEIPKSVFKFCVKLRSKATYFVHRTVYSPCVRKLSALIWTCRTCSSIHWFYLKKHA